MSGNRRDGFFYNFCLAYPVTVTANLACFPIDTVRRRLKMISLKPNEKSSAIQCAQNILKNEGIISFFKSGSRSIVFSVSGAIVLAGFEKIKYFYSSMKWY